MDCKNLRDPAEAQNRPEAADAPLPVLAAVTDLFFVSKISGAAKQAGCCIEYYRDAEKLTHAASQGPCFVIVDLNASGLDPVGLIARLKSDPSTQRATVIAYLSHVQHELKREAEKAGADLVLPRSVFSQNLLEMLRQRSCHL
jgi:CheY-like chemotaxis protein